MKLCSVDGIEIKTDILSVIIFAILIYLGILQQFFLIFIAFFLHEVGHIVIARLSGLTVKSLRLTPFGGIAEIESFYYTDEKTEFSVAIAGPLINITLAVFFSLLTRYIYFRGNWMDIFIYINAMLAGINLIPALPLDGGRALRAIMRRIINEKAVNNCSVYLSIIIGVALILWSIYYIINHVINLNTILLGVYIIVNAIKEKKNSTYTLARGVILKKRKLDKYGYIGVMPIAANKSEKASNVISNFSSTKYNIVAILNDDMQLNELIGEEEILCGAIKKGAQTPIGNIAKISASDIDRKRK